MRHPIIQGLIREIRELEERRKGFENNRNEYRQYIANLEDHIKQTEKAIEQHEQAITILLPKFPDLPDSTPDNTNDSNKVKQS